jgi:hypothetical protein
MKEVTIKTFQYDELSDEAKEKAREWYRRASSDDSFWHECVTDDAARLLGLLGYSSVRIGFRGFWSQGDGANFAGSWYSSNYKPGAAATECPKDVVVCGIDAALGKLVAKFPGSCATVVHRGHYQHEMCTDFDTDAGEDRTEEEAYEFDERFTELSRDLMRWIYRWLEKEYEWQNSNEQVAEMIRANEYEFTEEGSRSFYL